MSIARVKKGQKQGEAKEFYPDGTLKSQGRFEANLREGIFKYYNEDAQLMAQEDYLHGVRIERREFDAQGRMTMEQTFYPKEK